jgi:hypothetical protein
LQKAVQQPAGEAGDEAAAAERLRGGEAERGERNDRDVQPMFARPPKPGGESQDRDPSARQNKAGDQADPDLLENNHHDMPHRAALDLRADSEGEQDHDDRHADTVIEAALQVQRFASRGRDGSIGDHRRAECGVGRCEQRGQ